MPNSTCTICKHDAPVNHASICTPCGLLLNATTQPLQTIIKDAPNCPTGYVVRDIVGVFSKYLIENPQFLNPSIEMDAEPEEKHEILETLGKPTCTLCLSPNLSATPFNEDGMCQDCVRVETCLGADVAHELDSYREFVNPYLSSFVNKILRKIRAYEIDQLEELDLDIYTCTGCLGTAAGGGHSVTLCHNCYTLAKVRNERTVSPILYDAMTALNTVYKKMSVTLPVEYTRCLDTFHKYMKQHLESHRPTWASKTMTHLPPDWSCVEDGDYASFSYKDKLILTSAQNWQALMGGPKESADFLKTFVVGK